MVDRVLTGAFDVWDHCIFYPGMGCVHSFVGGRFSSIFVEDVGNMSIQRCLFLTVVASLT